MRGFTLIEVITAVFLLTVGVVGVFSAVNYALSATQTLSSRLIASYLAQEGIEVVRNIRDSNWLEGVVWDDGLPGADCGVQYNSNSCPAATANELLNSDGDGFYSYSIGTATPFTRSVSIGRPNSNTIEVTVTVTWQERGRQHVFTARENLTNWH